MGEGLRDMDGGGAKGHGWGGTRVGEELKDMGGEGTRVVEGLRDMGGEGTRVVEYMEVGCRRTHSNAHTIPASPAKGTLKLVLSISTGASAILEQELVKMFSEKDTKLLIEHPHY